MPTDVKLGAGYIGSIMEERFPNQYRDSSKEVQTYEQGYYQFPGAQSGHPRAVITDPDQGRAMKLMNIPGIGDVAVPVDATIGQVVNVEQRMAGMGQVVNVEQRMAGMSDVNPNLPPIEYATKRLTDVAVSAANEGLKRIVAERSGSYASWEKLVRRSVHLVARQLQNELQWTHGNRRFVGSVQSIMNAVLRNTFDAFSTRVNETLKGIPRRGIVPRGTADWQGTMMGMGSMTDLVANLVASKQLDKLRDALSGLMNQTNSTINLQNPTFDGYMEAKKNLDAIKAKYPLTTTLGFTTIPNPITFPAQKAFASAVKQVQFFARLREQVSQIRSVYRTISSGLRASGVTDAANMIDGSLLTLDRAVEGMDKKFNPSRGPLTSTLVPEYGSTLQKLRDAAFAELNAQGVPLGAYDSPYWLPAILKAYDRVVSIPEAAKQEAGATGLSGLGLVDPVSWTVIIIAAIKVLAALAVAIYAMSKILPDTNLKARETAKLITQKEADWSKTQVAMIQAGKTQAEIDAARTQWDKGTKEAINNIPDAPSLLSSLTGPIGIVGAAILAGIFILK